MTCIKGTSELDNLKRIEGAVVCDTTNASNESVTKFKDAFQSIVEQYISTTPIDVLSVSFDEQVENELVIIYSFDGMPIKYESGTSKVSSTKNDAEFGRALFEFYAKFAAESVDPNNLKVKSKHTELTIFSTSIMGEKSL